MVSGILCLILWLRIVVINGHFPLLYNTDRTSEPMFDCFYAHIADDIFRVFGMQRIDEPLLRTHHFTSYCIRPSLEDSMTSADTMFGMVQNIISFRDLRQLGINNEQLRIWSASIDILEQYAMYLVTNDTQFDRILFNNCSLPWFGSRCQYTFNSTVPIHSFGNFVRKTFADRYQFLRTFQLHTCYPHLPECIRDIASLCLDWREICDGKVDCNGKNLGLDEQHCDQLELNECDKNEYRCHNGAQCIPLDFLRDGKTSTDCLDQTDELEIDIVDQLPTLPILVTCVNTSTFHCEEVTCRHPRSFACGDGKCVRHYTVPNSVDLCKSTGRAWHWTRTILTTFDHLSTGCAKALFCALKLYNGFDDIYSEQQCLFDIHLSLKNNCSGYYVAFPTQPILYGYFQFIYWTNRSAEAFQYTITPDLVCNDPRQCLQLPDSKFQINELDCRPSEQFFSTDDIEHWAFLSTALTNIADQCSTIGNERQCTAHSSLFHCGQSNKCISKHRLVDGIDDCYYREDEQLQDSCALNDSQRFKCTSETKCLSPIALGPIPPDCIGQEDHLSEINQRSPFTRLCDIYPSIDQDNLNETDETHCDWWPCYNPYTRCDDLYQCADGYDEMNCPNSKCSSDEHMCYSEESNDHLCIPLTHIYEKILDCSKNVSHTRNPCREIFFANHTYIDEQYVSWSRKKCISEDDICGQQASTEEHPMCKVVCPYYCSGLLMIKDTNKPLCLLRKISFDLRSALDFSPFNLGYMPSTKTTRALSHEHRHEIGIQVMPLRTSLELSAYCNRGILMFEGESYRKKCLCPPSYFGARCQWQSQRVSLTLRLIQVSSPVRQNTIYDILISLIDDRHQPMNYHENFLYVPTHDCNSKYNIYLLYPTRPKNNTHNYSVHIDAFDKMTLNYHASWHLPIYFQFLPVNRLATQLVIPVERTQPTVNCSLPCGTHGQCFQYRNSPKYFCQCAKGYSGPFCNNTHECSCSNDSLCWSSSLCICPLNKFGLHCHLQRTPCEPDNPCEHNGKCVPIDHRIGEDEFICLCPENYMGPRCEHASTQIDITINLAIIPPSIVIHFITAFEKQKHERTTTFKKVPFDQSSTTFSISEPFNLIFIEIFGIHYLAVRREEFIPSEQISAEIRSDYSCPNITKLFNATILAYHSLRRLKYYQLPCRERSELECFYDNELMCVCDKQRFTNCFDINYNMTFNCRGYNHCENEGQCFEYNISCPQRSMCMCKECFYGSRCQFITKGFGLSFDAMFGYYIKPLVTFSRQSFAVKLNAALTTLMLLCGFVSGALSILTFQCKESTMVGCGHYLRASSIISVLTVAVFYIKFWQLILSQMSVITSRSLLTLNCVSTDAVLKVLLASCDWLHASVAIERAFAAVRGVHFDKKASKRLAKWFIPAIVLCTTLTYIHDPIYRRLMEEEEEEQRIWCVISYPPSVKIFDGFINTFHFLAPVFANTISALVLLITVARSRSHIRREQPLREHLRTEFKQHKHLFISPCILIILALPRLVIAFLFDCMKSGRDPWLFIAGYYISFVPPMLIFMVFVLPSETYKQNFVTMKTALRRRVHL